VETREQHGVRIQLAKLGPLIPGLALGAFH